MAAGVLVFVVLIMLAMTGHSDATWCICRSDVGDPVLQKSLDYACGAGADCTPILQGGACFQPNTVRAHCSYAVNSYFQNKGQAQGTCVFSNTATITQSDPSTGGTCVYPSTASPTGNGTTPPSITPPSTTFPGPGGTGGGFLGPTRSINNSSNGVRVFLKKTELLFILLLNLLFFSLSS